jgi:hypothetical protein
MPHSAAAFALTGKPVGGLAGHFDIHIGTSSVRRHSSKDVSAVVTCSIMAAANWGVTPAARWRHRDAFVGRQISLQTGFGRRCTISPVLYGVQETDGLPMPMTTPLKTFGAPKSVVAQLRL